ncbi:serine-rich adhesin for platelets [Drosophila tropicalis]|uniref:serine-rich adhesin for platelets n=1 Tax=Drosophila tropicalis TaxID=46794 RepID=UPI0035AB9CF3
MAKVADSKPETETKPIADEKADLKPENVLVDADANADASIDVKSNDAKIGENINVDTTMDELSSLEQEIAKMHNAQLSEPELEQTLSKELANDSIPVSGSLDVMPTTNVEQNQTHSGTPLSHQLDKRTTAQSSPGEGRSESTLKDADLIALLKGTDTSLEQAPKEKSNIELALAEMDVGVTIEGEGQYEIIEVDDDDNGNLTKAITTTVSAPNTTTTTITSSTKLSSKAKASSKISASGSSYGGKIKLSPEQARAVALEQMADLSSQKAARRKETQSQAILVVKSQDIVSSLNDDWNEYDSGSSDTTTSHQQVTTIKKSSNAAALTKKSNNDNNETKTAASSLTASTPSVIGNVKPAKAVSQNQVTTAATATTTTTTTTNTVKEKAKIKTTSSTPPTIAVTPDAPSGFKRVIKRKIIWDPDAPETQKSFAQYASSSSNSTKRSATPLLPLAVTVVATGAKANVNSKVSMNSRKEAQGTASTGKKPRASTPKDQGQQNKSPTKRSATPNATDSAVMPTTKRRSQTPSTGTVGSGGPTNGTVKKKKVSEIDRLMGDEGAANMIQAVEHEQREMSGGELSNKPLMRKRAMTITGRAAAAAAAEIQVAPPKKDSTQSNNATKMPTIKGTASRPSEFSSVVTPVKSRASDSSWDYVYKQRASEESMIVRRRSNSSYSSNASVSRLSLDNKPGVVLSDDAADTNDPSFKFLKPENKANNSQRTSGVGVDTAHTLANDLKRSTSSASGGGKTDLVVFNKLDKVAQLIINTHHSKIGQTYNAQLLHKLSETLSKLAKSNEYNTVLLLVQGQQFCQGIDCQELVAGALEKRKSCASQLASVLKTYLRTLATFPKPLVAGVIGNLKNLGVMQLPLFDYVVSAEDCTFETNYTKLGQLPEGYALWHKHEKVSTQTHGRLFLLGERLGTSDLLTPNSFIDKSCKSRSVNDEALAIAKLISTSSAETYRTLKKLNHLNTNTANLARLEEEFEIITEQWSTANCQANFKRYLSNVNI